MTRYWHAPGWRLSRGGSWQDHIGRGSPGGEDFPLGHGTSVFAPTSGLLIFRRAVGRSNRSHGAAGWDGGGQVLVVIRDDGVEFTLFHASAGEGVTLDGPGRRIREGELAGKSGGRRGTASQGKSTGPHAHEHVVAKGRRYPISAFMGGLSGGGVPPTPDPTRTQEDVTMTTAYATKIPAAAPPQADIDFLNTLLSSGPLIVRAGVGLYALCGDSPGTRANVQLTQLDALGNAWAADHSGYLEKDRDGLNMGKGVRWLGWPHFIATLRAYLTPLAVSAPVVSVDGLASKADVAAAADRVIAKIPTTATLA